MKKTAALEALDRRERKNGIPKRRGGPAGPRYCVTCDRGGQRDRAGAVTEEKLKGKKGQRERKSKYPRIPTHENKPRPPKEREKTATGSKAIRKKNGSWRQLRQGLGDRFYERTAGGIVDRGNATRKQASQRRTTLQKKGTDVRDCLTEIFFEEEAVGTQQEVGIINGGRRTQS